MPVPAARSTGSVPRKHKEQPPPPEPSHETTGEVPSDSLLATWTAVFPLSQGLAHRVRQHAGPDADAELVAAIEADYVRELSERASSGCRITGDGDLFGPHDFDGTANDVLFTAVFTTDLDAIVRRHSPVSPSTSD